MIRKLASLLVVTSMAACGGNPFVAPDDGDGTEPPPVDTTTVVVPAVLKNSVNAINYNAADDAFEISLAGLDTTPVTAVWLRNTALESGLTGFRAYSVQEDPLDRMFVGLARESDDGTTRAAMGGDGGQFNRYFSGAVYDRDGGFTPPTGTGAPGSGQVSYAGDYAGLLNTGVAPGPDQLPIPPGTDPDLEPRQPFRVSGEVFINANFSENLVNGAVYNRVIVDNGFNLDNVILIPSDIAPNGTFQGEARRSRRVDLAEPVVGDYGGVFGGTNAGNLAGILSLTKVYEGTNGLPTDGDAIDGLEERGIFVLRQCGLSGASAICSDAAPDY
ncbi:MAG: thymidylate synthase [Gemmobacter sp.]|nr:thymidylate synthase [Gemmobacter sp.]